MPKEKDQALDRPEILDLQPEEEHARSLALWGPSSVPTVLPFLSEGVTGALKWIYMPAPLLLTAVLAASVPNTTSAAFGRDLGAPVVSSLDPRLLASKRPMLADIAKGFKDRRELTCTATEYVAFGGHVPELLDFTSFLRTAYIASPITTRKDTVSAGPFRTVTVTTEMTLLDRRTQAPMAAVLIKALYDSSGEPEPTRPSGGSAQICRLTPPSASQPSSKAAP